MLFHMVSQSFPARLSLGCPTGVNILTMHCCWLLFLPCLLLLHPASPDTFCDSSSKLLQLRFCLLLELTNLRCRHRGCISLGKNSLLNTKRWSKIFKTLLFLLSQERRSLLYLSKCSFFQLFSYYWCFVQSPLHLRSTTIRTLHSIHRKMVLS